MMRPLRIAQVAPLYERVPPLRYGGTERVVSYLTEGLVESGHDVTLFASGDSLTRAELVPGARRGLRLEPSAYDSIALHLGMLLQVYDRAAEFDVIHCHTDYLGLPLARHRVPRVAPGPLSLPLRARSLPRVPRPHLAREAARRGDPRRGAGGYPAQDRGEGRSSRCRILRDGRASAAR